MGILVCHSTKGVIYAPQYVHRFRLVQPHLLLESEKFNLRYTDPAQLTTIADKLRWHRYRKGLRQRDVADFADIDRSTYVHYEEQGRDYYPLDKLAKVAELLEVEVADLIDDYNRFLYDGQGWQVKKLRTAMGLSQLAFRKRFGVNKKTIARWEGDKVTVLKRTWEKLFGDG